MRKSGNLKYQTLFKELLNDIESGALKSGQKLPSEEKLAEKFEVSRVTVRSALDALEELDYIERTRGKGTFIKTRVMEKRMNSVISFTESTLMMGNTPSAKVLEFRRVKAPLLAINFLNIAENDDVWFVKRIRQVNGLTALYEESYWVAAVCGELTAKDAANSILTALSERGIKPQFGKQEFVAIGAAGELARNLEVPDNFPILRSTMAISTYMNQPMFLAVNYYRTDRISLSITRTFYD